MPLGAVQSRRGSRHSFAVLVGLHLQLGEVRGVQRRDRCQFGVFVQQQQVLEGDIGHLRSRAEQLIGSGQCHLAVGGTGQGGDAAHPVVGQPGQHRGADIGLPGVPLGFLDKPHMCSEQRMGRHAVVSWGALRAGQQEVVVGPHRKWHIEQPPGGVQRREIHSGTGGVEVAHDVQQAVRCGLVAAQARQSGDRRPGLLRGLLHGAGEQRVWGELGEDPIPVLESGLHRRREAHGVAQIVRPVGGVAGRQPTGVLQGR